MTTTERVPTTVFCGERCHLGEGPTYDPASDTAWWFDIVERRLFEARIATGAVVSHALPVMASALAVIDDARQLLVTEDGLYVRDAGAGGLHRLVELEADTPSTRSNDARVHPSGTFWIGTMGRQAETGAGSLYAFREGAIQRLYGGISIPNAICFAPDGATGYFTDSAAGVLMRVPLDPASGLPVGDAVPLYRHAGDGGLDGAVVDADGRIWCAIWGGGRVDVLTPAGDLVRSVAVPAAQPSCPAFVGAGLDRLLVTSAYQDMDEAARAADPDHGRTFLLDIGVRGRPEPRVRLGSTV